MGAPVFIGPEKTEWTEEEYLAGVGLEDEVRYEYVRGKVYAMATPTAVHAEISSNLFVPLHRKLRGQPCRPYMGNMALRINFLGKQAFYIPDVMVACDGDPAPSNYRESPLVLAEVMSPGTVGTDSREKLLAYTAIISLKHYLIIHQQRMEVMHYERTAGGWESRTLTGRDEVIRLPELEFSLTVGELYELSGL